MTKIRMYSTVGCVNNSNTVAMFNSLEELKEALKKGGKDWARQKEVFNDLRRDEVEVDEMKIEDLHLYRGSGENFGAIFFEKVEEA